MSQAEQAETALAAFAARDAFGRLVGYLSAHFGTLSDAEDALADALLAALSQWPQAGVPANPTAWLLTVARRRLADGTRRSLRAEKGAAQLALLAEEAEAAQIEQGALPDERLRLLLLCTHPAIDRALQAPLMLQTVLGFQAAEIADAFLIAPNTMGQRLARAKTKIRESGLGFDVPPASAWPDRVAALLDAIYVCYKRGWAAPAGSASSEQRSEALWLAELVTAR
ncbi:MAG: sigma factor [Pseudomonadota bacterium]